MTSVEKEQTEKLLEIDIKYMGCLEIKRWVDLEQEADEKLTRIGACTNMWSDLNEGDDLLGC